jgi:AAA15 family ATPase/GTPase
MESDEVANLWDRVVVRPKLRDHLVKALRLIDPNIQEVVMLQGKRAYSPVPVLLYDEETRRPLRSLGDGVSHLFHMILATVSARSGIVLFDEFENGLHWSVQPLVWKTIFELAVDLDLQVFATTHSWDCVQAFKDVAMEHETEAMLFHLGRSARTSDQGKVIVTEYDKESLDLATRAGLEVR